MQHSFFRAWCIALAVCPPAVAQSTQPNVLLNSFESAEDLARMDANGARPRLTDQSATQGRQAVEVEFQAVNWPHVRMATASAWDWSSYDGLAVDVTNPSSQAAAFGIRVDDDPQADGNRHSRSATTTIEPGTTATFVLNLGPNPMSMGMRGVPVAVGLRCLGMQSNAPINRENIVAFQIYMQRPDTPRTLILDNIRLTYWMVPLEGIVDPFGQYAKADWPGKITQVDQFAERRLAEEAELKKRPSLPERDAFGGWTDGPSLAATGYFRTERVNGRWWLVTPQGRLFWSIGMDCVTLFNETITTGREHLFSWLPAQGDPLARHIGQARNVHSGPTRSGATFNFFAANLERKYGADYAAIWLNRSVDRLIAWGFNTIANWSDHRLYGNGRIPYVATVHIGGDHARLSSGSDYWGQMHDVYDPKFAVNTEKALRAITERVKDDPWCVGYFVDNELSWGGWGDDGGRYGLAGGALAQPATSPAKQAMLKHLKARYAQIADLNRAWSTTFSDWEALKPAWKTPSPLPEGMKPDLSAFVTEFARRYFQTVRDALRRLAPHHLYLGCRFAWHTPEAVAASAEICDVVSLNIYLPRVDPDKFPVLKSLDRPCIIGEFHFGALDRGMFHTGLVATESQRARADMYRDYVRSAVDHPLFVGCHWFQYVDQPLTGRSYDGENYNIGFLTVTDNAYPEMLEAAREVHREVYSRRWDRPAQSKVQDGQ